MKQFNETIAKKYYKDFRESDYSSFDDYIFDLIYTFPDAYGQIIDEKDVSPLPSQVWRFIDFCEEQLGKTFDYF